MANPVAWFEITGPDAGALQKFYGQAFDWEIDAGNESNYGMVTAGQGGIPGGVGPHPAGAHHATFYIAVDDVDAALAKVVDLGAEVAMPPMDVPEGPRIAFFTDPAGNQVGIMSVMG
ncbi:MAG TPA: VOC family protein [Streptosporangiaceae bacterium]|nr:VOC family protein [Streptosporangiaceae bacterium]